MHSKKKVYIPAIIISLGTGGLSALITRGSMDIYSRIEVPYLAPPGFLFPIVWTVLYVLMGIGAAMVYLKTPKGSKIRTNTLSVYGLSLGVNFFWPIIFFNMQAFLFAFVWLILLWFLVIIMIVRFIRVQPLAGYLQIPYLLWISFALYLNLAIYILN